MLQDKTILKIQKIIRDDNLNVNDLSNLIAILNRIYMEWLVKDFIIKYMDNSSNPPDKIEFAGKKS